MEKLEFSNHQELVAHAERLMTKDYPVCVDKDGDCLYRFEDRRCIIGRLFYGHIPEDDAFWDAVGPICSLGYISEFFPWMDLDFVALIQHHHDNLAGNPTPKLKSWEWLRKEAKTLDDNGH